MEKTQARDSIKRRLWLGGTVIVLVLAGVVVIALIFGRNVPTDDPQAQKPPTSVTEPSQTSTALDSSETDIPSPVSQTTPASQNTSQILFPKIVGTDLLLKEVEVPAGLGPGPKLIVVAYEASQQGDVDGWLPPLEALNNEYPEIAGYYVPLLPKSAADGALFIIGGMALAARNDTDRARTIVVFTDVDAFNQLVNVLDKSAIQLFLLDSEDRILWHETGSFEEVKIDTLRQTLATLRISN